MNISKEQAYEILSNCSENFSYIEKEFYYHTRFYIEYRIIFKIKSTEQFFYFIEYVPISEFTKNPMKDVIKCYPIKPVKKLCTVYENV